MSHPWVIYARKNPEFRDFLVTPVATFNRRKDQRLIKQALTEEAAAFLFILLNKISLVINLQDFEVETLVNFLRYVTNNSKLYESNKETIITEINEHVKRDIGYFFHCRDCLFMKGFIHPETFKLLSANDEELVLSWFQANDEKEFFKQQNFVIMELVSLLFTGMEEGRIKTKLISRLTLLIIDKEDLELIHY